MQIPVHTESGYELVEHSQEHLRKLGYTLLCISVFDHWLSNEEATSDFIMCYDEAVSEGRLNEYIQGEEKFLSFYRMLAGSGKFAVFDYKTRSFKESNRDLEKLLIKSLREKKLMDLLFIERNIRVIGNYDRTDILMLPSSENITAITKQIKSFGLHVLTW